MKYTFLCPQCKEAIEKEMTVAEYEKYEPVCEHCRVTMERVYEMPTVKTGLGDSSSDDQPENHSSCGGSCSTCSTCGL